MKKLYITFDGDVAELVGDAPVEDFGYPMDKPYRKGLFPRLDSDGSVLLDESGSAIMEEDREKWLNLEIRPKRDMAFSETQWISDRHFREQGEIAMGIRTNCSLTEEEYKAWLIYWKGLAELPESIDMEKPEFPQRPGL